MKNETLEQFYHKTADKIKNKLEDVPCTKIHWNTIDQKYNLIECDDIKIENYVCYVVPRKTIDYNESRLVRLAYRIHLFFKRYTKNKINSFINSDLGIEYKPK